MSVHHLSCFRDCKECELLVLVSDSVTNQTPAHSSTQVNIVNAIQHIACTQGAASLATARVQVNSFNNSTSSYSTVRSRSALQPQDIRKVFTDTRYGVAVLA
jgi:hypothetical protein